MIKTVVTADDFGFSKNINKAIIDCYEQNRITELSLMVDCYGTAEAVKFIKEQKVKNVGLHFSLVRLSKGGKVLRNIDYDQILDSESQKDLVTEFLEEVELFEKLVGFKPSHIIGHKQIALHPKLVEFIGNYCVKNNCYARSDVKHKTLIGAVIQAGFNIGRTTEEKFTFKYGIPEEMYRQYKNDIRDAKGKRKFSSLEFVFHPGYTGEFEKNLTSFIQERIDDAAFLLSDYFLRLVEEEGLRLVPSKDV